MKSKERIRISAIQGNAMCNAFDITRNIAAIGNRENRKNMLGLRKPNDKQINLCFSNDIWIPIKPT